ncbi:MAG: DNA polymerase III subunit delta [Prevotellaceae bacterium]|jgi:DNA polymerase-3 subunit delta|nr:DNA polymerase III subunit delta [Prevotellaceae bacterium]
MAKYSFNDAGKIYEQIVADIKRREYKPVYLLMGEEPFHIDALSDFIAENILNEAEKTFDQMILYGKDTAVDTIFYAAIRPPMMAKYQVIIVREAQDLDMRSEEKQSMMETSIARMPSSTILVLCFKGKTLDKRLKLYNAIKKKGVILETAKMYADKLPDWIITYLKQKGVQINPKDAFILAEHIGNDLSRIVSELDKLFILLPENSKTITAEHIEKNIGISKEYNSFELGNALLTKDIMKVNRIIAYFGKNPKAGPAVLVISSIFSDFTKLFKYQLLKRQGKSTGEIAGFLKINPFFLKDYDRYAAAYPPGKIVKIIELLREYDMKSKGWYNSATSDAELFRELAFKIMH